uniref:CASK interacting protein 1 n=1 Tax=Xiphophorus couchianus TaxID=32473 RepID=A0A3B5MM52_9TELE
MGKDQELLQAVKTEDLLTVQKLLQRPRPGKAKLLGSTKKVNVNFQDIDGNICVGMRLSSLFLTCLLVCCVCHSSLQSEMLLQHQSNPCIVDNAGKTPLDLACEFGRVGVVQLLLSSNMCAALLEPKKGDTADPNGTSPLHLAAKNGHIDIIRLLIQAGIDINRQTKAGTALHEAALCGKTEVVRLLLESGINAAVRNTYSQTALDIVYQFTATQASREIKQLLRDASAALQVRALKDYCNNYDLTSLNIKAGDVITVLEQHPDGRWKGCIHDNRTGNDRVGYFPSTLVEVISKRTGCRGSEASPQSSPTPSSGPHGGSNEEIWVLRKPVAGKLSRVALSPQPLTPKKSEQGQTVSDVCCNLGEWLSAIGLSQYHQVLVQNGYENIDFITDITWEDLQEIGITKLGHQKKLMLAVKRLAEMQRSSDGRGSLRKKPPPITQQQEVISMDSPPPDEVIMSPKMSTFQDSELSSELQNAIIHPGQEVRVQRTRTLSKDHDDVITGGGGPPKKEARTVRQQSSQGSSSSHRGSVSSQGKHRHSHNQPAPPYTPPHTPTKTRTSSSSSTSSIQSSASPQSKTKPSPQAIQGEQPPLHSHQPQSPTHRGAPCQIPQQQQPQPQVQQHQPHPHHHHPQTQVMEVRESPQQQVPHLCLPPEAELEEAEGAEPLALKKKRAHSLNRYAVSDGECDERVGADGVKYATVTHRVSRSHSVRNQEKTAGRSHTQSFALRQKKKGPPPPPPKRSSSAISSSNSNLTEANTQQQTHTTTGGMLDVPYHQQRRASDLGVSVETAEVETNSMGSVRSIAAMLEMSSIGGGAKGMALPPRKVLIFAYPQEQARKLFNFTFIQVGKTREAIGLDGEVVNRRRTISGPVSELVEAARREQPTPLDFGDGDAPPGDGGFTLEDTPEATGTLKRRPRISKSHPNGSDFTLQESSTVKRRPKSRDKEPEGFGEMPMPYQNGMATVKRRLPSEAGVTEQPQPQQQVTPTPRRDSTDQGAPAVNEAVPMRKPKPPVSPKPVVAQIKRQGGPQSSPQHTFLLYSLENDFFLPPLCVVEGKKIPPPVSPKPAPPPTAPKPAKLIHSMTSPASPTSVSTQPTSPSSQSPHTPQTPTTPQTPQTPATPSPTPPPVKPPRSSIGAVTPQASTTTDFGVDSLVQQKLEETSASLAAALQAVEDKILRQDDSVAEQKTTVSILDDIGSMFDDLADQLDAMLE